MDISLIINAPSLEAVEQLRAETEQLRAAGHRVRPHLTFEAGDAEHFAKQAVEDGASLVIAGGGDGTINEVANGMHAALAAGVVAPNAVVRLGLLPLGTANDLASALEIPTEIPAAVDTAVNGVSIAADVARVNGRCFLNVSTGGFGAEATDEAPNGVKRALGPLAYMMTGVKKFAESSACQGRFMADGKPLFDGKFFLFAVGNSRRTGGGNFLTPRADLSDGLLDVCIVKEMGKVEFAALMPELRAGNHLDNPHVLYKQVASLQLQSEAQLSVNADGEPVDAERFAYDISPHKLHIVISRKAAQP